MASNPITIAQNFCEAWNRHDVEGIVASFGEHATVRLNPPAPGEQGEYAGLQEIRQWVEGEMPGFHVDSTNYRADGATATFDAEVVSDEVRHNGIVPLAMTVELQTNGDDKVSAFSMALTPETLAKVRAAMQARQP